VCLNCSLRSRFEQCLADQPDRVLLRDLIDGSDFAGKTLEREFEQIALAEAASGTVASGL
jgi:hypothetical protein